MSDIKTKFINDPENITAELLEGYALAYPNQVKLAAENIVVRANPKGNDKVAIVTLGGSGHEPALSGFVGEGMLDALQRSLQILFRIINRNHDAHFRLTFLHFVFHSERIHRPFGQFFFHKPASRS